MVNKLLLALETFVLVSLSQVLKICVVLLLDGHPCQCLRVERIAEVLTVILIKSDAPLNRLMRLLLAEQNRLHLSLVRTLKQVLLTRRALHIIMLSIEVEH